MDPGEFKPATSRVASLSIKPQSRSRIGDKFDWSMTRGKLLDNDTQLFIFISILIMTQLHPRDPENRQQNRFSERRFSEKNNYNRLKRKALRGLLQLGLVGK